MRRSGTSHSMAAERRSPWASQGDQKVSAMATTYRTGESLPFQSLPTALLEHEVSALGGDDRALQDQ